jgi:ubiquinone/menaquinone biosynthesis C-methylase UbiE
MDRPNPDREELRQDLINLEIINRFFGGKSAVLNLFKELTRKLQKVRVIDLATGFADHPRAIIRWAQKKGKQVHITAVDFQWDTLRLAREATPNCSPICFVQADIRHLPFKPSSAELVFSSLALHHFSEKDAIRILQESQRVATRAAACIDLVRGKLAYVSVWILTQFILRGRMTRHDARASILRAFNRKEFQALATSAGWSAFWHWKLPWFRQAISLEKNI